MPKLIGIADFYCRKDMDQAFCFTSLGDNLLDAVITDKRVSFKGECLSGQGRHLTKTNEERAADLSDITGSGFIYRRQISYLFIPIIVIILLSVSLSIISALLF